MKVVCESCNASFKIKGDVPEGKSFKFKCPKCKHVNRIKADDLDIAPEVRKVECEDCGTMILEPPEGEPQLCEQCRASRAVKEAQRIRAQAEESPLPDGVEFPDELFSSEEGSEALAEEETPELVEPPEEAAPEKPAPEKKAAPEPEKPEEEEKEEEEEEVVIGAKPPEQKPQRPDSMYRVRSHDGLMIGPVKLATLRDLIVAKKVHSDEDFSRDEGPWMSMAEFTELFEIFQSQPVKKAEQEEEEVVEEDLSTVIKKKDKILSMLKVKKNCAKCGEEIFVIEDVPTPLCDQCRIEALVTKKSAGQKSGEALFRIRSPDGLVLGPLRRSTIEDLVAAKNVRGVEEVSVSNGPWKPIIETEELADLFDEPVADIIDLTETLDA